MLNIKSRISSALFRFVLIQNEDSFSKKLSDKFFAVDLKSIKIYFKITTLETVITPNTPLCTNKIS